MRAHFFHMHCRQRRLHPQSHALSGAHTLCPASLDLMMIYVESCQSSADVAKYNVYLGVPTANRHSSKIFTQQQPHGTSTGAIQRTPTRSHLIYFLESVAVMKDLFMPFQDFLLQCSDQSIIGGGAVHKQLVAVRWRVQIGFLQHTYSI